MRGQFSTKVLAAKQFLSPTQAPWLSAASEGIQDRKNTPHQIFTLSKKCWVFLVEVSFLNFWGRPAQNPHNMVFQCDAVPGARQRIKLSSANGQLSGHGLHYVWMWHAIDLNLVWTLVWTWAWVVVWIWSEFGPGLCLILVGIFRLEFGCGFFAYSNTVGSFLLTVELFYLQLAILAFLLTIWAFCLQF